MPTSAIRQGISIDEFVETVMFHRFYFNQGKIILLYVIIYFIKIIAVPILLRVCWRFHVALPAYHHRNGSSEIAHQGEELNEIGSQS